MGLWGWKVPSHEQWDLPKPGSLALQVQGPLQVDEGPGPQDPGGAQRPRCRMAKLPTWYQPIVICQFSGRNREAGPSEDPAQGPTR